MLKTYLARALSAGARLICNTSAEFIRGQSVIATTSDGRRVTIRAQKIIVAAGAVETAALLQRSGLGGAAVGRHLRLHPTTAVVGVYDERIDGGSGIPLSTYCDEFAQMRRGYGHWIETAPLTPGLAALALAGFGESHRTRMREYPHWAPLIVLVRDGSPDDPSRGRVTWRGGRARIDYRLSNADRSILLHGMESAARIHFAMGARSVFTLQRNAAPLSSESQLPAIHAASVNGDPLLFSAHVNGTARLGSSPKTGVCRPDGALHTHPHVYVMDGSLLPTAPGVNPHETIAAVVSMLATKLTA